MAAATSTLQPTTIQHLASAVYPSFAMLAGMQLDVFTPNIFDAGRSYTESEHRTWLTALGFAEIERVPLPEGVGIITARKPI